MTIGANYIGNNGGLNGDIDELRIYNHALSAQEVQQLYHLSTANAAHSNVGISNGLVGYWTMDGGSIDWRKNQITDMSGNGNTGTLVNLGTTTSPVAGKIGQALSFDGSTNFVTVSSPPNLNTAAFSLTGWFKTTSNDSAYLFHESHANGGAIQFVSSGSGDVDFGQYDSAGGSAECYTAGLGLANGIWYHFAVV